MKRGQVIAIVATVLLATTAIIVTLVVIDAGRRYDECIAESKTQGSLYEVLLYQEQYCK